MKEAYLYDFDGTICPGDAGSGFFFYCLLRRPYILVFLPFMLIGGLCYILGILPKLYRFCSVYCYLPVINAKKLAKGFAKKKASTVYAYFAQRNRDLPTVVCSASPEFLLRPICDLLEVEYLVATDVDVRTGFIRSGVCKGRNKIEKLSEAFPDCHFREVYSDSLRHDIHILKLGDKAFHIVKGEVRELTTL